MINLMSSPERIYQPVDMEQQLELSPDDSVILLDDTTMVQRLILAYARHANRDNLPTPLDQRSLIKKLDTQDPVSIASFIQAYSGLLATLAYPFISRFEDNTSVLLNNGAKTLLGAISSYMRDRVETSYVGFVAPLIQDRYTELAPWAEPNGIVTENEDPVQAVYRFLSKIKKVTSDDDHQKKQRQDYADMIRELSSQENSNILRHIHLPNALVPEKADVSIDTFYRRIGEINKCLGIANRSSLALACLDAGIEFDLSPMPSNVQLSDQERLIAPHLHNTYEEIAKLTNVELKTVCKIASKLRNKLGARSRTELVLMLHTSGILGGVEQDFVDPALEEFTEHERRVLALLHLPTPEIAAQLNLSNHGVWGAMQRAYERTGTTNRLQLAMNLRSRGYIFDILTPSKPLDVLFDERQFELVRNLHLEDDELEKITGYSADHAKSLIYWFQRKSGARSQVELLLMAHQFDTGERRKVDARTKKELLADKLGWTSLDMNLLQEQLDGLGHRERTLIADYYFSDESVSWRDIAERHKLDRTLAIVTARNGILRIRKRLAA